MSKRLIAFVLTLALMVLALLAYLLKKNGVAGTTTPAPRVAATTSNGSAETAPTSRLPSEGESNPKLEAFISKVRGVLSARNRPIDFYGKVVDQYGSPVPGVRIDCQVEYYGAIVHPDYSWSYETLALESDGNGLFAIRKRHGVMVEVRSLSKQGYEFERGDLASIESYSYADLPGGKPAPTISTATSPVIFRAYKKGQGAALIHEEFSVHCEPDGEAHVVDLLNKRVLNVTDVGGDFKVAFQRPAILQPHDLYDWTVEISGIDGGVIESTDPFMYQAPENGYNSKWRLEMKASSPTYRADVTRTFYLRSRGGRVYGRLKIGIWPNYQGKSALFIDYWLNPNGSTNLEDDHGHRITLERWRRSQANGK